MIIQLNENLRIEIDGSDKQLQKRSVIKKEGPTQGNEVWSTVGYYGTLTQLTTSLLDRHIGLLLPENITDVRMLAMVIEEVGAEVAAKVSEAYVPVHADVT